jgi:hypothetical protein
MEAEALAAKKLKRRKSFTLSLKERAGVRISVLRLLRFFAAILV